MKALITGGGGQLSREIARCAPKDVQTIALTKTQLDISDQAAVAEVVTRERPAIIFNTAVYRYTDRAESEPERAFAVNGRGAGLVAMAAVSVGARMVHISTDFVFDGEIGRPYRPEDEAKPLSVYGASKLAGERAVAFAAPEALIVRTAWLYAAEGQNFLTTMLDLMATNGEVRVVADQVGTPTSTATLAETLWNLLKADAQGLFHCTDAGVATWYDFAQAIAEEGRAAGLLKAPIQVRPILTHERPAPARRPPFSVLDKSSTWAILDKPAPHWRIPLRGVIADIAAARDRQRKPAELTS